MFTYYSLYIYVYYSYLCIPYTLHFVEFIFANDNSDLYMSTFTYSFTYVCYL